MSNKKDIEISNKLLSWVFGCEVIRNNAETGETDHTKGFIVWYTSITDNKESPHAINLDTFIRLAKTKACEKGFAFEIDTANEYLEVSKLDINLEPIITEIFLDVSSFDIDTDIKVLEWVVENVGGEG